MNYRWPAAHQQFITAMNLPFNFLSFLVVKDTLSIIYFHNIEHQILTWALVCRTCTYCWSSWCTPSHFLHNALDVSLYFFFVTCVKDRGFFEHLTFSIYSSNSNMFYLPQRMGSLFIYFYSSNLCEMTLIIYFLLE